MMRRYRSFGTRWIALLLCMMCMCCMYPMMAQAGTIDSITASYNNGTVTINGTVATGVVAVVVQLYDGTGTNMLAMQSVAVSGSNYSASFTGQSLAAGTYIVKAADYAGGAYVQNTFTVGSSLSQPNNSGSSSSTTTSTVTTPASQAPVVPTTPSENVVPTSDEVATLDDVPMTGELTSIRIFALIGTMAIMGSIVIMALRNKKWL